jgi:hypothetical protein
VEQCRAAATIKERYGLKPAFDYLVAEKLVTFAEAAGRHPEFARELPGFVSEVRRIFALHEIQDHLARIEREQAQQELAQFEADEDGEGDDVPCDAPAVAAERLQRFMMIKQLLLTPQLGTS